MTLASRLDLRFLYASGRVTVTHNPEIACIYVSCLHIFVNWQVEYEVVMQWEDSRVVRLGSGCHFALPQNKLQLAFIPHSLGGAASGRERTN